MPKSLLDARKSPGTRRAGDSGLPPASNAPRASYDSMLSAIHCLEHSDRRLRAGEAGDADAALALLRDAVGHLHEALIGRHPNAG